MGLITTRVTGMAFRPSGSWTPARASPWLPEASRAAASFDFARAAHTSTGITGTENTLRVALLPSLPLGGATAHNVVLLVLDDNSLTFPVRKGHSYQIERIIGFPVLRALGRLSFHHAGTLEASTVGEAASDGTPLELRLLNPIIEATSQGQALPFTVDTGASGTTLSVRYFERFQKDKAVWKTAQTKSFGAGGATVSRSYLVRTLPPDIGDRAVYLHNVPVLPVVQHSDIDALFGNLGENLFHSVESFTLDFKEMRFSLGEPLPLRKPSRRR